MKAIGGGRADGTTYVGSAEYGGLAVGMLDFWERCPTQIDLSDLDGQDGAITLWIYSPQAEPLDTSTYHNGLSLDSSLDQLEALNVTYEDHESGFATANGIGRTNVCFLRGFEATPSVYSPPLSAIHRSSWQRQCIYTKVGFPRVLGP